MDHHSKFAHCVSWANFKRKWAFLSFIFLVNLWPSFRDLVMFINNIHNFNLMYL